MLGRRIEMGETITTYWRCRLCDYRAVDLDVATTHLITVHFIAAEYHVETLAD